MMWCYFCVLSRGRTCRRLRWTLQYLHQIEIPNRVFLKALHHRFEHVEGFFLVLDQRIVLAVAAQPDALFQVIHAQQVIFPLLIDHAEHDHALVMAHGFGTDEFLFGVVAFLELGENGVAQLGAVQSFGLHSLGDEIDSEAGEDRVFQAFDVPVVGVGFGGTMLFQLLGQYGGNVILKDEVLLIEAFEQAAPQAVHGFALLIHDIVIFEQVFAGLEMLPFDGFLRGLDAAGDELGLDGHSLFHAQTLQKGRHPFLGKDAHQVIFKSEIEAG